MANRLTAIVHQLLREEELGEEWAEQVVAYVEDEVGEPCVVVGQSNLCTVALEAACG